MDLMQIVHPRRRKQSALRSTLETDTASPSRAALAQIMRGYREQGANPSSGTRPPPRAHLERLGADGSPLAPMTRAFDRMIADTLIKGPTTSGVLRGVFGITPGLTGR